jgi:hypothetical protein
MTEYIETAREDAAFVALPAPSVLAFLLVHAYGALLVEPILERVFGGGDDPQGLDEILRSQRDLVRRALTGRSGEDGE